MHSHGHQAQPCIAHQTSAVQSLTAAKIASFMSPGTPHVMSSEVWYIAGRLLIAQGAVDACKVGTAIAIRYSCKRPQFGEKMIMEYITQQRRLLPGLATTYAMQVSMMRLRVRFMSSCQSHATTTTVMCRRMSHQMQKQTQMMCHSSVHACLYPALQGDIRMTMPLRCPHHYSTTRSAPHMCLLLHLCIWWLLFR